MMKDPVCGMQVDEKKSPTSMVEGKKYAFCSQSCKDEFDANPQQYASSAETHKESTHKARA
jgi:YHS domain-containing protein